MGFPGLFLALLDFDQNLGCFVGFNNFFSLLKICVLFNQFMDGVICIRIYKFT